jgi:peptidylprolyl isomerase
MARAQSPNSANSQFFIMFAPAPFLDGKYTIIGNVTSGMDVVDKIKKGPEAANGQVDGPDKVVKARLGS